MTNVAGLGNIHLHDCAYCGLTAQCRDHVIPQAYEGVGQHETGYGTGWKRDKVVPACSECNCLLGRRWLPSVAERAAFLAQKLRVRHEEALNFPNWNEDDLEDMSPRMRKQIRAKIQRRDLLKARIAFADSIARMELGPQDCWGKAA
jgi:hypothetical protein